MDVMKCHDGWSGEKAKGEREGLGGVMRGTEYEAVQPGRARCLPLKTQAPLDSKLPVCVRTESELLHTHGKSSQKYICLSHA